MMCCLRRGMAEADGFQGRRHRGSPKMDDSRGQGLHFYVRNMRTTLQCSWCHMHFGEGGLLALEDGDFSIMVDDMQNPSKESINVSQRFFNLVWSKGGKDVAQANTDANEEGWYIPSIYLLVIFHIYRLYPY